ncbi:tRNA (guanine(26)-N(2))-dimethyltransferase-like [Sycon ciliatum]|uniref:tRNA (guanine(26)-N(2))-dimethyltransferase-like n=1 Tax=Sycon ciliatum TaxID=27933 RepID=UPI0031F61E1E|eukprot:scpid40176/ scgid33313/ tRNA (guanine(26)-N(2))-dimethyltransferase; tRNA 2,2-dimethylguanosine-26 methyltransferase; tRNA(guanine-26,N(2)-N(2)) methyltransferase; tRNA(m(2,2)G26)dimethyltransferase
MFRTVSLALRTTRRTVLSCTMATEASETSQKFSEVCEGEAKILFPDTGDVFYNPVQEFNRDISIAVIKAFSEVYEPYQYIHGRWKKPSKPASDGASEAAVEDRTPSSNIRILEALSATGLRSVRYAKEIPKASHIVANDYSEAAVSLIQRNVDHNGCADKVKANCADASVLMQNSASKAGDFYDVVDLDPYGAPSQFLDGAVKCVAEGGLLCVTCTDLAVLCGNHGEACYSKYGSVALRSPYCHEMALRILLASVSTHACRYQRYIEPVVALSVDFYIRVFVRVYTGQGKANQTATKLASVHNCVGCNSFHLQPISRKVQTKGDNYKIVPGTSVGIPSECTECGSRFNIGGPIWTGPMHDKEFVDRVIDSVVASRESYGTADRIIGMLSIVSEDLHDVPLHYSVTGLSRILHVSTPKVLAFRSALIRLGYRVSYVHSSEYGLRTDAPTSVVFDILRAWVKTNPIKDPAPNSPAAKILSREPAVDVCFDILPEANPPSRQHNLLRYQINPEPNWGPKCKAKKRKADDSSETEPDKRKRLQDKRTKKPKPNLKMYACKNFKEGTCPFPEEECRYHHNLEPAVESAPES